MPISYELDTLASGMVVGQERYETLANNVANVNAIGFKKNVHAAFAETLAQAERTRPVKKTLNDNIYRTNWPLGTNNYTYTTATSHSQGDLRITDNPLDIALVGKGFFAVKTAEGVRLTRSGSFMLDANGQLVTGRGETVLVESADGGDGAPLTITGTAISVMNDGTIQADGVTMGKLRLVDVADYTKLVKTGQSMFAYQGASSDVRSTSAAVEQGYLESSNVNSISEMTAMLANTRQYELAGKSMKNVEQTLNRALSELSKFK